MRWNWFNAIQPCPVRTAKVRLSVRQDSQEKTDLTSVWGCNRGLRKWTGLRSVCEQRTAQQNYIEGRKNRLRLFERDRLRHKVRLNNLQTVLECSSWENKIKSEIWDQGSGLKEKRMRLKNQIWLLRLWITLFCLYILKQHSVYLYSICTNMGNNKKKKSVMNEIWIPDLGKKLDVKNENHLI